VVYVSYAFIYVLQQKNNIKKLKNIYPNRCIYFLIKNDYYWHVEI
jgi:hypothetical protein